MKKKNIFGILIFLIVCFLITILLTLGVGVIGIAFYDMKKISLYFFGLLFLSIVFLISLCFYAEYSLMRADFKLLQEIGEEDMILFYENMYQDIEKAKKALEDLKEFGELIEEKENEK